MNNYILVTGFYPSKSSAEKVLKKARAICKSATIEPYEEAYMVVLAESSNYNEIDNLFSKYMKQKLYCGVMLYDRV